MTSLESTGAPERGAPEPEHVPAVRAAVRAVAAACACAAPARRESYADVVRKSSPTPSLDPPPQQRRRAAATLGRPGVSLPVSQLTLGRTAPPWMGSAWKTAGCAVVGDVLRVRFPRGSGAFSAGGPPGGCNFKARPRVLPVADATLTYRVRFEPRFPWSRGGKLPGLFVGPGEASGGQHSPTGASGRVMWLRGGQAVAYVYLPAGVKQSREYREQAVPKGRYGDEVFDKARMFLVPDDWNDVVLRVKVNGFDDDGAPRADGTLSLSVNGRAASVGGITWRRSPDIKIDHIAVTSFFGGAWKSPRDTWAEFTRFALTT